ncbi:MAG: methyltransferase domain-containing protein [bacterium]|nr:methyltransferase domain-containing protein [bacterium]
MSDTEPVDPIASRANKPVSKKGLHHKMAKALLSLLPWRIVKQLNELHAGLDRHEQIIAQSRIKEEAAFEARVKADKRFDAVEAHLHSVHAELQGAEREIQRLQADRIPPVEHRLGAVEENLERQVEELARIRGAVVPAAVGRIDALIDRLTRQIEENASLLERVAAREPLPLPSSEGVSEENLAEAMTEVHADLFRKLRGSESEIQHRLRPYLDLLKDAAPVLDLGCGRGELLLLLREAGVSSRGVEHDPATAAAARRRGLQVVEGDLIDAIHTESDGSLGSVTAIHVFEHLSTRQLVLTLNEARRILRPGGVILIESPNPNTLRVGANEFWLDPTHIRPLPAETLRLFLVAAGFVVDRVELLHPFPDDQRLEAALGLEVDSGQPLDERLREVIQKLDEHLNGPRDFSIIAHKPSENDPSSVPTDKREFAS